MIHLILKYFLMTFCCFLTSLLTAQDEDSQRLNEWLLWQRTYPYDTIPQNGFSNAIDQQESMRQTYGYTLSGGSNWATMGPTPYYNYVNYPALTGRIMFVKYAPNDANTIYVGGHLGGLWKSTNAGSSWAKLTDDFKTLSSGDLAFDPTYPNNPNILYYATGGGMYFYQFNFYGLGVYKSTNAGTSWTGPYRNGLPATTHIFKIIVNPNHDNGKNDVWIAEGTGLFKSTDGGVNWSKINLSPYTGNRQCTDIAISSDGDKIYVVGTSPWWSFSGYEKDFIGMGFWISTDYGASFVNKTTDAGLGFHPSQLTRISISPLNDDRIYAATIYQNDTGFVAYTYRSTNSGSHFDSVYINVTENGMMLNNGLFIKPSPHDELTAIAGWGNATTCYSFYETVNGGVNYSGNCANYADQKALDFNPEDEDEFLLANDGGLWRYDNFGAYPQSLNLNLSFCEDFKVVSLPTDPNFLFICQTDNGFLKKDLNNNSWLSHQQGGDGTNLVISKNLTNMVATTGALPDIIWYSTNAGANFTQTGVTGDADWIGGIAERPDQVGTFYHPRRDVNYASQKVNIWRSTNSGMNWSIPTSGISYVPTNDESEVPWSIVIYPQDYRIMYVTTNSWLYGSEIYKSTNGGSTWGSKLIYQHGVPGRVVTSVTLDPCHSNIIYITLSGFGNGHVYKSENGGTNWSRIDGVSESSSIPDIPANNLCLRYVTNNQKELIVANDIGVYRTLDFEYASPDYNWQELSPGLPNVISMYLDLNYLSRKLRVATFGRGVYEVQLSGTIVLKCNNVIKPPPQTGVINVDDDIVIPDEGSVSFPDNCTVQIAEGKKIWVQRGGTLDVSSSNSVTFTSQSGQWGGIVADTGASLNLNKCTFENTETPIVMYGDANAERDESYILIDSCIFNGGSIYGSGRIDVSLTHCTLNDADTNGISLIYCSEVVLAYNNIYDKSIGITLSNSTAFVSHNYIENTDISSAITGMSIDNDYSSEIKNNNVQGYDVGYYLYNASPNLYTNISYCDEGVGNGLYQALSANYYSSPLMRPTMTINGLLDDAGYNDLQNTYSQGIGINLSDNSQPVLDYGYGTIYGTSYHLSGYIEEGCAFPLPSYNLRDICWIDNPPIRGNLTCRNLKDTPYYCDHGGGGHKGEFSLLEDIDNIEDFVPPDPLMINYGHGNIDTIWYRQGTIPLNPEQSLFAQGRLYELQNNYTSAKTVYAQIVTDYADSVNALVTVLNSLKKILYCSDKNNASSNEYSSLRSYYTGLSENHNNDTALTNCSNELASKCLVRLRDFTGAITEYETIIENSNDSLKSLCAELNIIETYTIMQSTGGQGRPTFTGRLVALKPHSTRDAVNMINVRLHKIRGLAKKHNSVPITYTLSQNYPNPFNPYTTIKYSLPKDIKVTIKIYDILGREIQTLVNDFKKAGYYDAKFDGSNFASGVYFYRIEAGDFIQSKKMVLIK